MLKSEELFAVQNSLYAQQKKRQGAGGGDSISYALLFFEAGLW